MRLSLVVILALAASAGTAPRSAAQAGDPYAPPRPDSRPSFEYFLARNRLETGGSGAAELTGVGGRVLWPLAGTTGSPLLSRGAVGGYLVHSPAERDAPAMWHYGVQADLRLTPTPLAGRVEPLLSLGVGAVRTEEPARREEPLITVPNSPLLDRRTAPVKPRSPFSADEDVRARTDPSLVPGVGARLHVLPWLGLRGDVRMLVDFRDGARRDLEIAGGLSITA